MKATLWKSLITYLKFKRRKKNTIVTKIRKSKRREKRKKKVREKIPNSIKMKTIFKASILSLLFGRLRRWWPIGNVEARKETSTFLKN